MIRELRLIVATWLLSWVSDWIPSDHPAQSRELPALARALAE